VVWGHALKEAFFDLYSIACVKHISIAVHLKLSSGSHQWNVNFLLVRCFSCILLVYLVCVFLLLMLFRLLKTNNCKKLMTGDSHRGLYSETS
jgi:hypothetical protein